MYVVGKQINIWKATKGTVISHVIIIVEVNSAKKRKLEEGG